MKRIFLLTLLLMSVSTISFSQGILGAIRKDKVGDNITGSLSGLKEEGKANLSFDFESIMGMSESEFAKHETDWEKDKLEIEGLFLERARIVLGKNLNLGYYSDAKYTLKAIINIDHIFTFSCDCEVLKADSTEAARISGIQGSGSNVGTKLQQIKSSAKTAGNLFGKTLKKFLKQEK